MKFLILLFLFSGMSAHAQGLTIAPTSSGQVISADNTTITLIVIRLILVLTLIIAGMFALMSGHHWLYAEGNTKKAKKNKVNLGKALLVITAVFFLLILFRVFVPDYSTLAL